MQRSTQPGAGYAGNYSSQYGYPQQTAVQPETMRFLVLLLTGQDRQVHRIDGSCLPSEANLLIDALHANGHACSAVRYLKKTGFVFRTAITQQHASPIVLLAQPDTNSAGTASPTRTDVDLLVRLVVTDPLEDGPPQVVYTQAWSKVSSIFDPSFTVETLPDDADPAPATLPAAPPQRGTPLDPKTVFGSLSEIMVSNAPGVDPRLERNVVFPTLVLKGRLLPRGGLPERLPPEVEEQIAYEPKEGTYGRLPGSLNAAVLQKDCSVMTNVWYDRHYRHPMVISPGKCGIMNQTGVQCYINSVVQCLSNTPLFHDFFVAKNYRIGINTKNPMGSGGAIAEKLGELLRDIWKHRLLPSVSKPLWDAVGQFRDCFSEVMQQDAQEFLAALLDALHEDYNEVRVRMVVPKFEPNEADDISIEDAADECWKRYLIRNRSFLVQRCMGMLMSTLQCRTCSTGTLTFDPYMQLTLELPESEPPIFVSWLFFPEGYPAKGRPVLFRRHVSPTATISDLVDISYRLLRKSDKRRRQHLGRQVSHISSTSEGLGPAQHCGSGLRGEGVPPGSGVDGGADWQRRQSGGPQAVPEQRSFRREDFYQQYGLLRYNLSNRKVSVEKQSILHYTDAVLVQVLEKHIQYCSSGELDHVWFGIWESPCLNPEVAADVEAGPATVHPVVVDLNLDIDGKVVQNHPVVLSVPQRHYDSLFAAREIHRRLGLEGSFVGPPNHDAIRLDAEQHHGGRREEYVNRTVDAAVRIHMTIPGENIAETVYPFAWPLPRGRGGGSGGGGDAAVSQSDSSQKLSLNDQQIAIARDIYEKFKQSDLSVIHPDSLLARTHGGRQLPASTDRVQIINLLPPCDVSELDTNTLSTWVDDEYIDFIPKDWYNMTPLELARTIAVKVSLGERVYDDDMPESSRNSHGSRCSSPLEDPDATPPRGFPPQGPLADLEGYSDLDELATSALEDAALEAPSITQFLQDDAVDSEVQQDLTHPYAVNYGGYSNYGDPLQAWLYHRPEMHDRLRRKPAHLKVLCDIPEGPSQDAQLDDLESLGLLMPFAFDDIDDHLRESPVWRHLRCLVDHEGNLEQVRQKAARDNRRYTVDDCLEKFTSVEALDSGNLWHCPKCKEERPAKKKFEIWSLPNLLFVHVKRFSCQGGVSTRLRHAVEFPMDNLDMGRYLAKRGISAKKGCELASPIMNAASPASTPGGDGAMNPAVLNPCGLFDDFSLSQSSAFPDQPPPVSSPLQGPTASAAEPEESHLYHLLGLVCHHGVDIQFGHYTSLCRHRQTGEWLHFNDDLVTSKDERSVLEDYQKDVYLLVYVKSDSEHMDWTEPCEWPDLTEVLARVEAENEKERQADRERREKQAREQADLAREKQAREQAAAQAAAHERRTRSLDDDVYDIQPRNTKRRRTAGEAQQQQHPSPAARPNGSPRRQRGVASGSPPRGSPRQ